MLVLLLLLTPCVIVVDERRLQLNQKEDTSTSSLQESTYGIFFSKWLTAFHYCPTSIQRHDAAMMSKGFDRSSFRFSIATHWYGLDCDYNDEMILHL